jgi:hypothetical protein
VIHASNAGILRWVILRVNPGSSESSDSGAIWCADHTSLKQELCVEVTRKNSSATLSEYVTAIDELNGTLNYDGSCKENGKFKCL